MYKRLVSLALAALAAAVLISAQPARADHVPNDATLDLEHGLPLVYPLGLSMFNIYWDKDWDANNPGFARADIDAATKALADSNYFDKTAQYGVPDITFSGSAKAVDFCGGTPTPTTSSVLLVLFLLCEEATPGTGVPYSFGERIYNVIVPRGTTLSDLGSNSCVGYNAYHFSFPSLPGPLGVPPGGRPIIFTVIPAACASDVAGLMSLIAHEAVEAATDPAPLEFWADFSSVVPTTFLTVLGTVLNPLKEGEAADICQKGDLSVTYGGIAMEVGAYWSNADNACVVGPSRVVSMTFAETGVPTALSTLEVGGTARSPGTTPELEGTTFAFPGTITDPANAAIRYVRTGCTGGPASGTVTFPVGNVTANASASISCAYAREVFVQIATAPAAAASGNTTLTASQWVTAGTSISVTGDEFVAAGTGTRYAFRGWNDGNLFLTSRSTSFFVSSPVTVTAYYWPQHLVAFDQSGIPAATTWHVNVAGSNQVGPTYRWVDEGTSVAFSYESPVAGTAGTRYVLSGVAPPSPLAVFAPGTVTGTYNTQHRIDFAQTGIPANGTVWHVTIDGIQQPGPASKWVDDGDSVSYSYETPVADAGTAGTRYVLSGTSTSSPLTVASPVTVVGTYSTQYLLTVQTSGLGTNTTPVRNGVSLLGTATDATPLAVFLPLGTVLSLNVGDPVNGAGGTQHFFQTFSPAQPGTLAGAFTTTASYKTMSQQIDGALAGGGIQQQGGAGVAGALKLQWAVVEADLAADNFPKALTDIESFVAHLAAQSGKKVTIATSRELRLDAANVYLYALCRAVALGQINATTHSAKYAYYSALVTSLGGTPRPNC